MFNKMSMETGPKTPDAAAIAEALKNLGLSIDPTHPEFLQFVAAAKAGNFSEDLDSVDTDELKNRLNSALDSTRDQNGYINPDDSRAERFIMALENRGVYISRIRAGYGYGEYKMYTDYLTVRTKIDNSRSGTFAGIRTIGFLGADGKSIIPAEVDIFI